MWAGSSPLWISRNNNVTAAGGDLLRCWRIFVPKLSEMISVQRNILIGLVAVTAAVAGWLWVTMPNGRPHDTRSMSNPDSKILPVSQVDKQGKELFNASCAVCHGKNAAGTKKGPPLIHKIYEPGHHSDLSFQRAAKFGVRAHHWPFGNMPPVPNVTESDVTRIIAYVRALQRANGIR